VFRVVLADLRSPISQLIEFAEYLFAVVSSLPLERGGALLADLDEVSFVVLVGLLGSVPLHLLLLLTLELLFLPLVPDLREITLYLLYTLY
jgi:hypothetical protein